MSAHWITVNDWLLKEEDVLASAQDPAAQGPPGDAGAPGMPGAGAAGPPQDMNPAPDMMGQGVPAAAGQPVAQPAQMMEPETPDVPEEKAPVNFEEWKSKFFKETIKGDVNQLIDMIQKVRNDDLDSYPRKFVEDNLQILFLRQNANIEKASNAIRKAVRDQLDKNNPSVSIVQHMFVNLQSMPELTQTFIKIMGLYSSKSDAHRKYIASLLGAVQVGSGGASEDLIFNQREYSIKVSTRCNSKFGLIDIGRWCLKKEDEEHYLSESELERLEDGSPEEREVLRKRVIIESVSEYFRRRAFIVNVVNTEGTVFFLGLDFSNSLKEAYTSGKLVVKIDGDKTSEAMYDSDGNLVSLVDIKIVYEKETGKTDENGKPLTDELDFISRKDGVLMLTASLETLKEASSSFQGLVVKEVPFTGNPSDLVSLSRCVPSTSEMILRNC
jgi:hypothetical protein